MWWGGAWQGFLEIRRVDRRGEHDRLELHSLSTLDLEFAGNGNAGWPGIAHDLARHGRIDADARQRAARLWTFGI